jgi:hypothetical protein
MESPPEAEKRPDYNTTGQAIYKRRTRGKEAENRWKTGEVRDVRL